ncbi:MAG: DUF58 domain-containing protein [Armatimonadetes bacterium]|nr:DUF58 domain-containing protein [Armatimonadota bacterium]MDW8028058.1 DUF58 domain-containing protein [Armatimonadota bacterium]
MLEAQLLARLERLRFKPRKVHTGTLRGERLSKRKGISIEFADFRPYAIGDDTRHLDWKILARLDRPIVRTYRDETELPVYLLLDDSISMQFGNPSKWQIALQLATALGYIALCGGDVLFAIPLSQTEIQRAPLRGKGMFSHLLRLLKGLQPEGKVLAEGLFKFSRADLPKGLAVLLTDGLDENFPDALRQLASRSHEILLLQILSDAELEPNLEGDLRLLDCETEEAVEITATLSVMREYMNRFREFCQQLEEICRRAGGWHLRVTSNMQVSNIVFRHLRHLGVIGLP